MRREDSTRVKGARGGLSARGTHPTLLSYVEESPMSARLDLVLVNPSSRRRAYQSLGQELAAVEPPVWARLLASFCLRRGMSVAIIDAEAEELGADEVADQIGHMNPTLTAIVVYGHQPSAS